MANVAQAVTIEDLRAMAHRRLPRFLIDYVERGNGSGAGVRRNAEAFRDHLFVPRAFVDVTCIDTTTELFGRRYAYPFGITAVGTAGLYRRGFDEILAEVAQAADIPFLLSGAATASVETVSRIAPDHVWFQLYPAKDPALTHHMLGRARDAGIRNLVFTVDFPIAQTSDVSARTGLSVGAGPSVRNLPRLLWQAARRPGWSYEFLRHRGMPAMESWRQYAPPGSKAMAVGRFYLENWPGNQAWTDLERVRRMWPGKLVVKGLVHPDDVRQAAELGADAVTVSNHGGNKLDCMQGSVDALRAIKASVGERIPLFLDGGIRRGSDLAAALALGAGCCFIGRAALYGVAAGGLAGGHRAVEIIAKELAYTMAMIGCPRVADIGPGVLAGSAPAGNRQG